MRGLRWKTLDYQFTYGALLYLYSIAKVISNINRQPPNARACSRSPMVPRSSSIYAQHAPHASYRMSLKGQTPTATFLLQQDKLFQRRRLLFIPAEVPLKSSN